MNTTTQEINPQIFMSDDILSLLGKKLYNADTQVILVRELIQNSVDAMSSKIEISYDGHYVMENDGIRENYTKIICKDNGIGMNQDTLLNVFLGIGKSKKFGPNNTGGFGIAKVSLFSALDWQLETNQENSTIMKIDKNSGELTYEERRKRKLSGTNVTALYKGYSRTEHIAPFLLISSKVKSKIRVNGKLVKPPKSVKPIAYGMHGDYSYTISKSKPHDVFGDGEIRLGGLVVYRINGLPQFTAQIWDNDQILIFVDFDNIGYLPRDDNYPFSLSRESVSYDISSMVFKKIGELTSDKLSRNLDLEKGKKSRFKIVSNIAYELKRGEKVSQDDKRIARLYKSILDTINTDLELEIPDNYIVGINFDEDSMGSRQGSNPINSKHVYWINPDFFGSNADSKDELIFKLYFLASHEITHVDYRNHDEEFTSTMGDNLRDGIHILLENLPKLRRMVTMSWYAKS